MRGLQAAREVHDGRVAVKLPAVRVLQHGEPAGVERGNAQRFAVAHRTEKVDQHAHDRLEPVRQQAQALAGFGAQFDAFVVGDRVELAAEPAPVAPEQIGEQRLQAKLALARA